MQNKRLQSQDEQDKGKRQSGGTIARSRGGIVLVGSYIIVFHKFEIWYFVYIVYMVTPLIKLLD